MFEFIRVDLSLVVIAAPNVEEGPQHGLATRPRQKHLHHILLRALHLLDLGAHGGFRPLRRGQFRLRCTQIPKKSRPTIDVPITE